MRKTKALFTSLSIVLLSSVLSSAQRSELRPLAANATLQETQSWLEHSLHKAGTFKYARYKNSLHDLKFKGCQMNFTNTVGPRNRTPSMWTNEPTILDGDIPNDLFKASLLVDNRFSFDLKEIDPELTSERTVILQGGEQKATYVILFADEATVQVKGLRAREPEMQRTVSIPLRPEDAGVIKHALHRAVELCQAVN